MPDEEKLLERLQSMRRVLSNMREITACLAFEARNLENKTYADRILAECERLHVDVSIFALEAGLFFERRKSRPIELMNS